MLIPGYAYSRVNSVPQHTTHKFCCQIYMYKYIYKYMDCVMIAQMKNYRTQVGAP